MTVVNLLLGGLVPYPMALRLLSIISGGWSVRCAEVIRLAEVRKNDAGPRREIVEGLYSCVCLKVVLAFAFVLVFLFFR